MAANVLSFAALAVIPLLFLLQSAVLAALGVLVDALLVRTLLARAVAGRRTAGVVARAGADGGRGSAPEADRRPEAVSRRG